MKKVERELEISHPGVAGEAVSAFLFERGATAIVDEEAEDGASRTRAAFAPGHPPPAFEAELKDFLAGLQHIFALDELPCFTWRGLADEDWSLKWRESHGPIVISPRLAVKPTWCEFSPLAGQKVLHLDPGMAFGTGSHATTYLCLKEIDGFFAAGGRGRASVLDIGCGSGILAAAAALFTQGRVLGVDNDPEVIPVAQANLELNKLTDRVELGPAPLAELEGPFDLVVANILAPVLVSLAGQMARLCAPKGRLALSGVLETQAAEVTAAFVRAGFEPLAGSRRDEWVLLAMGRRG